MIDKALVVILSQVNAFLDRLPELSHLDHKIKMGHVVNADGTAILDKPLGLCLVNIEEERVVKAQVATRVLPDGNVVSINPEIKLNLFVLVTANFDDYSTGLVYLSGVIRFFQSMSVFSHQNIPDMDDSIERLTVDLHTLSFEQQNHLWGSIGAKYLPSVLYKVRMLTVQEAQTASMTAAINELNISGRAV